jgi:hypothetical protein
MTMCSTGCGSKREEHREDYEKHNGFTHWRTMKSLVAWFSSQPLLSERFDLQTVARQKSKTGRFNRTNTIARKRRLGERLPKVAMLFFHLATICGNSSRKCLHHKHCSVEFCDGRWPCFHVKPRLAF